MTETSLQTGTPRRGDVLELDIEKAAFEGRCIAHVGDFVVFVDGAVPGDRVNATVLRKKKQFAEARVEEVLEASPYRVEPACAHFGVCGGCKWQHMSYEQQLHWKRTHVTDAFERIGDFTDPPVQETLPSVTPFFYRNKMEFSFGEMRWLLPDELGTVNRDAELFALGLHVPKRYDRILHIDECHLQSPESNRILNATRDFFSRHGIPAFSTRTHEGDLRHLVIREGKHSGERMVYLVTSRRMEDIMPEYTALLRHEEFAVSTLVQGVTTRRSTVAIGEEDIVHFGDGTIRETLGRNVFRISPTSFFQTNTLQAERLYALAASAAELSADDVVWDLYCGTGTISLFLARDVRHVLGVELNEGAIRDAEKNAADNAIDNTTFICADIVDAITSDTLRDAPAPDVIITDPPRAGMHAKVVDAIGRSGVRRLVYVSCNPATSARDCALLREHGYIVEAISPVDMFPHTYHIECVIRLRKENAE
ncbi:MAG: 23S rRNA (uracil(1939)-C(5))-methyltransferase RlmD [Bacteroidetes bacterium]|nr:23S rRNA (uracil(1939)-C(5))-methyltransferase RlmD [Bacteroidota bacterium]